MKIQEHDIVELVRDYPMHDLKASDTGTVIHIYPEAKAYEVEFKTRRGTSIAIVTVEPEDIRKVLSDREKEIQELCKQVIADAIHWHSNCNGADYWQCNHCIQSAEEPLTAKDIVHSPDCAYLIAKDLSTNLK